MSTLKSKRPVLWVTDPWVTLSHSNDTTLRLMREMHKMGIQTYWSASDFILKTDASTSSSSQILVEPYTNAIANGGSTKPIEMEPSIFHHLHYRIDPPVDFNYISLLDGLIARGFQESQIVNPPKLLKYQSEKIPPVELKHLIPRLKTIENQGDIALAIELFQNEEWVVTKPLNTAQSNGVKKWKITADRSAWAQMLETETAGFTRPIVVEEYLPSIKDGEVRVWFANGKVIAALKKFPAQNDFRVLIDEGSKVEAYTLSDSELVSAKEVGVALKSHGAMLAAIDFIGGKISDYNITSPGLLVQLEQVHGGKNFAREIIEAIC